MRKRRGAAPPACIIVHETDPASYGWNTVKNSNTNTQFDIVRQNPAAQPHAVRKLDPARASPCSCSAAPGLDFEAAKQAAKKRDFQPIDAQGDAQRAARSRKSQTITSHNVVGYLPGKKYPDETVIYSAHWDHLGIGKPGPDRRHHLQRRARQRRPASPS